jgi:CBS domain containing-hemolysin-like protein
MVIVLCAYARPSQLLSAFSRRFAERARPACSVRCGRWSCWPRRWPRRCRSSAGWRRAGTPSERSEHETSLTETEVEILVNEGELNGSLDHDQSEMIRNVLDFGGVTRAT